MSKSEKLDLFKLAYQEYEEENSSDKDNGDNPEKNENCKHLDVLEDNGVKLCLDCGEEIARDLSYDKEWRYYGSEDTRRHADPNRCQPRKTEDRTIFKDVENLGFSDRIVSIANDIYLEITKGKIYRGNSRKSVIFACVFHAFKMIEKPISCDSLNDTFKLERKDILKGLKILSMNLPKTSQTKTSYITAVELIDEIMNHFNATKEQKLEVVNLFQKVKNKSSMLNGSRPHSVASGLIYFYISNNTKGVNIKDFIKTVKVSLLTVSRIAKEVERIVSTKSDNSSKSLQSSV